jgi:hypothetical protein
MKNASGTVSGTVSGKLPVSRRLGKSKRCKRCQKMWWQRRFDPLTIRKTQPPGVKMKLAGDSTTAP